MNYTSSEVSLKSEVSAVDGIPTPSPNLVLVTLRISVLSYILLVLTARSRANTEFGIHDRLHINSPPRIFYFPGA